MCTAFAFAAILADGNLETWGYPDYGGDSSRVQSHLKDVRKISATQGAFAAILVDGSVVTWGDPQRGGDSSRVQNLCRSKTLSIWRGKTRKVWPLNAFMGRRGHCYVQCYRAVAHICH